MKSEIDSQIELRKEQLAKVIDDIASLMQRDAVNFVPRAAKEAFLSLGETAQQWSDEELKKLKAAAVEQGQHLGDEVYQSLKNVEIWLKQNIIEGQNKIKLKDLDGIWAKVESQTKNATTKVLKTFKLDQFIPDYREPSYFVDGKYLPSLLENGTRLIKEIRGLIQDKANQHSSTIREKLAERWDKLS